jgi:hypothetical protein
MSRMDTRDAQSYVQTRDVKNNLSPGVPPEEVTTFNLVRRLAGRRSASGGFMIALHSRPLEGGHTPSGRAPSGADLELAVEVAPGAWIDLALQAKKFKPDSGKYDGWDPRQNRMLVQWAHKNGRRAAGMLLYNSSDPPFAPPGGTSSVFNERFSSAGLAGLKDVDGFGELPGAPGTAAEFAQDAPGLELGVRPLAGSAEPGMGAVGVLL